MKFPTISEMAKEIAEKALDEYGYEGKTIRQWVEILKDYDDKKTTLERIVERLEDVRLLAVQNACLDEAGPECYDISCETCYMDRAIEIVKEEGEPNELG